MTPRFFILLLTKSKNPLYDREGKSYFFRLKDRRVLQVYLPTCDESELATVFSPVTSSLVEKADPMYLLHFSLQGRMLQKEMLDLKG